ncbi:tetratricopeptide repeat protein [Sessilibacter corallicola]|uniref:J domain-containing protein n=1 Tax=Sessilibacter corallicola TaxID=2904075 RepID=A0ABQ0AAL4_9GAMM
MSCWQTLNIKPTYDKKAIKKAYLKLLKTCNPEVKADEFMVLREAYETALKNSNSIAENSEQETSNGLPENKKIKNELNSQARNKVDSYQNIYDIAQLVNALETLYFDIEKRWLVKEWENILTNPVMQQPNTYEEAGVACIKFFLDHRYLSNEIFDCFITAIDFENSYVQWNRSCSGKEAKKLIYLLQERHLRINTRWVSNYRGDIEKLLEHLSFREHIEHQFIQRGLRGYQLTSLLSHLQSEFNNDSDLICFSAQLLIADEALFMANQLYLRLNPKEININDKKTYADLTQRLGDHKKAIRLYQEILTTQPNHNQAQKGLAKSLIAIGQVDMAITLMEDLLENQFYDFEIRCALINAYNFQLNNLPETSENMAKRGQLLYSLGMFKECIAFASNNQEVFDQSYSLLKAQSLGKINEYSKAKEEYIRIINLATKNNDIVLDAVRDLVIDYAHQFDIDQINDYIAPSLNLLSNPNNYDPQYLLAAAFTHYRIWDLIKGHSKNQADTHLEISEEVIAHAAEKDPYNASIQWNQGKILFQLERYQDAIKSLNIAATDYRVFAPIQYYLAECHYKLEQLEEATDHYEKWAEQLSESKKVSQAYLKAAQVAKENNRIERAMALLEKSIANESDWDLDKLEVASELYYLTDLSRDDQTPQKKTLDIHLEYIAHCQTLGADYYTSNNKSLLEAYSRLMHILTEMGNTEELNRQTEIFGKLFTENL